MRYTIRIEIVAVGVYQYGADTGVSAQILMNILAADDIVSGGELREDGKVIRAFGSMKKADAAQPVGR